MPAIRNYRGIIPAIACPFTADYRIDEPALRKLASVAGRARRRRRDNDQRPHRRGVLAHPDGARHGHAHCRRRAPWAPAGHFVDCLRGFRRRGRAWAHGGRSRRRCPRRHAAAPLAALRAARRATHSRTSTRSTGRLRPSTSSATFIPRGLGRHTPTELLADLARLPYVQAFKVGQRDMNKYARDIEAIRNADATKSILTCHDEYLLASMVQGIDGALVGFATFISAADRRFVGRREGRRPEACDGCPGPYHAA